MIVVLLFYYFLLLQLFFFSFFFFFQAEDGIRDLYVTGVQTCALPIWFDRCSVLARTWTKNASRNARACPSRTPHGRQVLRLYVSQERGRECEAGSE